jgi:predicted DNA-binding transcriptional regulator AlpA
MATAVQAARARPPAPLLTEEDAAAYLKLTRRALQAWRYQGRGPRFVKISARAVRYRPEDLERWIETRLRTSTVDPGDE